MGVIFRDDLQAAAAAIRAQYPDLPYDHRPDLPLVQLEGWSSAPWHTEEFRRGYACFKHAVAAVLKPRSICEIGVGGAVAALAFLRACPTARYVGIDDETDSRLFGFDFVGRARQLLAKYDARIEVVDTHHLTRLPGGPFDLVHVDGGHLWEDAFRDTLLAWESGAKWVLVDDARDTAVASAAHAAIRERWQGSLNWAYFEDTFTGSLLFARGAPSW